MSNLGPFSGPQQRVPTPPQGEAIGNYATYAEAQRAVDFLSDEQFPVRNVTIVGTGLQMVERVTGRLTYGRAAGAGAASGAWFGLLIGLMISVFGSGGTPGLFVGLLVGAGFGMLFGVISYALTGGRRDFTSASQIVAGEYTVLCLPQMAGQARQVLSKLPNGLGRPQGAWQQPQHPTPWGQPQDGPGQGPSQGQGPAQGQGTPPPPAEGSRWGAPWGSPSGPGSSGSGSSGSAGSHAAGGSQGSYGPPPQAGTGPATAPPPPAGAEPAPVEMDLSGPTYAQKIEEQRQQRRAAEQRAREEQGSGDQRDS